ncbi:PKD domain-containing protein [Streptomyces sp. MB09-01]|uniref:PKD domain-containing protein n=1 Tax=Streptomyces sp. MB09-01 TaxID=3028666 RepID=UPI0029BE3524|nr:PKD domain-containing protein [Streptomyces sp. MB09-01]MDX3536133.1 PKD domain-containing protein [Streptomyces sp. MB09-01]
MRSRRLVISVAVIAATVGLVPGMAHAAGPVAPAAPSAQGVAAPAVDLGKAAAPNFKTFKSPAERSVRKGLAAGKAGAGASQAAGNPDLALVLNAASTSAHALDLETTVISADSTLKVTVDWGDGNTDGMDAYGSTVLKSSHTYAELGEYKVTVTVTDPANQAEVVNEFPVMTAGSDFVPYAPTRLLDTRDGTGAAKGKVAPLGSTRVKVGANGAIPAGVTAVVLNLTVTNATSGGHITAFAEETERPTTSNVNFEAGQTVPNLVIVPVGKNGYVELANRGSESVDLIADVTGYFTRTQASGYTPMTPARFVDTREGLGANRGQLGGRTTFSTRIGGLRGVPEGITAVALNVTVTNPREAGHLSVFPGGGATPTASNLNFTPGQTVANSVIVPVGTDGRISVFNGAWAGTDVIVDVVGFYSTDSKAAYMPLKPGRMIDTRDPRWPHGPLQARGYVYNGISPDEAGIDGYVLNTTVTNTTGTGFLSVAPDPNSLQQYKDKTAVFPERPGASALNWTAGKTVPNLVQASSGKNGIVDYWNQGWEDVDLVVDIFGYYESK